MGLRREWERYLEASTDRVLAIQGLTAALRDLRLARRDPELVFHGADCPGHTTQPPGESCLAADSGWWTNQV